MGFQINGVEYIDNNGHFVNGLKTANGNSMAGTGAITTGNSSTWGTTFLSVGSFNIGFVTTNFNASGNYGLSSGYQRKGIEQGNTAAGSGIYAIKYTTTAQIQTLINFTHLMLLIKELRLTPQVLILIHTRELGEQLLGVLKTLLIHGTLIKVL